MSFLTPLYALGFLAIAAPIVFHLIRRTPRGEVPFSSLMFLSPSPPRLTRRSRLDHLLLLLLRATALCLLALAFTRPFWRQAAQLNSGDVERRRVALVIDTSASMRRGDLWTRAQALAVEAISACRPADQLAVFAFDASARPLLSFTESATLDPARRQAVARARVAQLAPGWGATHLGQSLIDAVAAIEDVADTSEKAGRMRRRVVLISDLQQGSRPEALGSFEWPSDVELELKTVADTGSNAGLHGLAELVEAEASEADPRLRVRVSSDAGTRDRFELLWVDPGGSTEVAGKPLEVYVPPGESRVVRVPRPPGAAPHRLLRLKGDTHAFDNTLFLVDEGREEATVVAIGNDRTDDPAGLLYYLERVFHDTPRRSVRIRALSPSEPLVWESESKPESRSKPERTPALVIVSSELAQESIHRLQDYVRGGGTVLGVVAAPGRAETLAALAGTPAWEVEEAVVASDVMLGEIAFDHPLFAPLAGAQFNDFTKIHFWKYRRIKPEALGAARVLARFENGDAAVVEKPLEKGRLIVLTSGWNPADSQLARSSKFVPLISGLLEVWNPRPFDAANHGVGDRVTLPTGDDARAVQGPVVHKPDGTIVRLARGSTTFSETDQPGVYTIDPATISDLAAGPRSFAVNLDALESKTSPLHVETLEQFGCRLANNSSARKLADKELLRQMQNAELENRQKFWRWLILATICVLILETWLAGRVRQPRLAPVEVSTS
jgi:Mg-chelatase subunit ChlD